MRRRLATIGADVEFLEEERMNDVMAMADIHARFRSEWVLLEDPETDDALEVQGGKVLWHSSDRDEVYRKAQELAPTHSAIVYTGTVPDDVAVIL